MSSVKPISKAPRPATLTWAAGIVPGGLLLSVAIAALGDDASVRLVLAGAVITAVGVAGAVGVWRMRKWGVWLSAILVGFNGLAALPGVAFADSHALRASAVAGVFVMVVGIALLFSPSARAVWRGQTRGLTTGAAEGVIR
jgi:hypothetical protein